MSNDDLPLIQVFPNGTESDAESEADRDAKHARAVAEWNRPLVDEWYWPVNEVQG
jgi:hypothetical protein